MIRDPNVSQVDRQALTLEHQQLVAEYQVKETERPPKRTARTNPKNFKKSNKAQTTKELPKPYCGSLGTDD